MPIRVKCPGCHKGIQAPSKYRGKKIRCPGCKEPLIVPEAGDTAPSPLPRVRVSPAEGKEGSFPPFSFDFNPSKFLESEPQPTPSSSVEPKDGDGLVECMFCSEPIKRTAKKCKHCGEFLDASLHDSSTGQAPVAVQVNLPENMHRRWSKGVAALLSFLIPGAGQLYKGQVLNGLVWFGCTFVGYLCFIIPGLIIHVCCIAGAASGDEFK